MLYYVMQNICVLTCMHSVFSVEHNALAVSPFAWNFNAGWLNDPHGLFQMNGTTHMFFQYNPKALQWGKHS